MGVVVEDSLVERLIDVGAEARVDKLPDTLADARRGATRDTFDLEADTLTEAEFERLFVTLGDVDARGVVKR